jgi:tetratricopeptide (TPR) repeat protein
MTIFVTNDRRIDVETTNDDGFDFERKVKESGARVIGIKLDPAKGHEVSDVGLASLVAQNRASGSGKDKETLAAIQAALVGIALDPRENAKANNFVAAVNEWAMRLGDADKYDDALAVMQFGMELMPAEDTLKNNAEILWNRYAVFEVKAGRDQSAVEVIAKAKRQALLEESADSSAAPFLRVASDLCDDKQWREAVAVIERGLKAVQNDSTAKLRAWLVQVHAQWAEAQRKDRNYDQGIDALAAMWKKTGEERAAREAIEYFAQESLREVEESGGPAAAAALLVRLRKEFPSVDYLNEAGQQCARRAIDKLLDSGKFDEAAAAIDRYQPLLSDDKARDELGGMVYDRRGRELMGKKKWADAVAAYGDGRAKFPTSELLARNAVVAWNGFAREAIDKDDLPEAIRIYERAIQDVGDKGPLKRNLEICRKKLKR